MIVVIEHFLERTTIDHGLIALETLALFSFERFDRNRTEFDSLHSTPRIGIAFENLNPIETCVLKRGEKTFFRERAGNAAAPKLRIVSHFFGHFFIAHDIADHCAPPFFQNPENFVEELSF